MINAQKIKKIMEENGNRLPFLPLDEFFAENPDEYAIAPNQCDDGRPSLFEMYRFFSEIEKQQGIAWIRVLTHCDTQVIEQDGNEVLELYGDTVVICSNGTAESLEKIARCDWLCADEIIERELSDYAGFSCIPQVKNGYRLFEIWWD